jgi:hypothetical protein
MVPEPVEEYIKIQATSPEEEREGLRILARLIAKAVINDAQARQPSSDNKPPNNQ